MLDLGMVSPGETLNIPFGTYSSDDPSASVTTTGLATTDIEIYKDGSLTQRASDSGYAVDTDFDAITGLHTLQIDLADNTTAGFFSAGSEYLVMLASITVDAGTINFVAARFKIGYRAAILNTTIATLASQTSFTLTKGPAENDALNGMWVVIHDVASEVQLGHAIISDYTGSTKTVTLAAGTTFTADTTDNISVMGIAPLQPTVSGRTLGVESDGDLTKVNTLNGHTAQTGDNFARLGAPAGASVSADIAVIEGQTDDIGIAGAGLTDLGGMSTGMKGEVNTEADTALTDYDPPTKAEMDTAHGLLATEAKQDIIDTNVDQIETAVITNAAGTDIAADIIAVKVDTAATLVDTAEIGTAGAGLSDLGGMSTGMKDEINAEVDTALVTTTYAESSGVPAATATIKDMLNWLKTLARNKGTQTTTLKTLRSDADDGDIATSGISDTGGTFTRNEWV